MTGPAPFPWHSLFCSLRRPLSPVHWKEKPFLDAIADVLRDPNLLEVVALLTTVDLMGEALRAVAAPA